MERNTRKIFIQRDYNRGTAVQFSTAFPRELTGKVPGLSERYASGDRGRRVFLCVCVCVSVEYGRCSIVRKLISVDIIESHSIDCS